MLIITFVFIYAKGQTVAKIETQKSNAEKFSETSGTLIQKEVIDIGSINSTLIQVEIFTDLITGKKASAVRFEKGDKIGVIDDDELDGLIKSLKIISAKILPTTVTNYTEVNFVSRSGFSAGCFWSKNKWSSYLKTEKYDDESYEYLDKTEDFDNLLLLLEQAKTKMI